VGITISQVRLLKTKDRSCYIICTFLSYCITPNWQVFYCKSTKQYQ